MPAGARNCVASGPEYPPPPGRSGELPQSGKGRWLRSREPSLKHVPPCAAEKLLRLQKTTQRELFTYVLGGEIGDAGVELQAERDLGRELAVRLLVAAEPPRARVVRIISAGEQQRLISRQTQRCRSA